MARITMREAISQALWEEMERDPKVFIMGKKLGFGAAPTQLPADSTTILVGNACVIRPSQRLPSSAGLLALP